MKTQKFLRRTLLPLLLSVLPGCAILHHVQVGQIDNRGGTVAIPFEVMVSENGISTEEIGGIARAASSRAGDAGDAAANVAAVIALFQMGPRTGKPVYSPRYAERMIYEIHQKCSSGRVTGLMSIREMRSYPVISGEIVKIKGYCLKNRKPASNIDDVLAPNDAVNDSQKSEEN